MITEYLFAPKVQDGFHDANGNWVQSNPDTVHALRQALYPGSGTRQCKRHYRIPAGERPSLPPDVQIKTEHGRTLGQDEFTDGLKPGFYFLMQSDGETATLWSTPARCSMPKSLEHTFGLAVQPYALRGRDGSGYGRFSDLEKVAAWAASLGASFLTIAPAGAPTPVLPIESSPYFPSSRRWLNPLHLDITQIECRGPLQCEPWLGDSTSLNRLPTIDRDRAWRTQLRVLWARFNAAPHDPAFHAFCSSEGEPLRQFAFFSCLATYFGRDWRMWPSNVTAPDSRFSATFIASHGDEVTFHMWMQWQLHLQLGQLSAAYTIIHDFPVGVDPGGADAWCMQDDFLHGFSIGAPPDEFSPDGQDWTVEPPSPIAIAESGAAMLRESVGALMKLGRGVRIDHVMGLWRLFCIPTGAGPRDGAYVRYPYELLLDSLAIQSCMADAIVVGEDLGTVEPRVREMLDSRGILRYKLAWFDEMEKDAWNGPDRLIMGAISTHDLPTIAGVLTGNDVADQVAAGLHPDLEINIRLKERAEPLHDQTGDGSDTIVTMHQTLRAAGAMLTVASLEDCLGLELRPNLPGTTTTVRANWAAPYPIQVEQLPEEPLPRRVLHALGNKLDPPPR